LAAPIRRADDLPGAPAHGEGVVTDGLVLLAAWLEFGLLLALLGWFLLRRRP
jgi:hypothetical protein